jgi:hypothetical protein
LEEKEKLVMFSPRLKTENNLQEPVGGLSFRGFVNNRPENCWVGNILLAQKC